MSLQRFASGFGRFWATRIAAVPLIRHFRQTGPGQWQNDAAWTPILDIDRAQRRTMGGVSNRVSPLPVRSAESTSRRLRNSDLAAAGRRLAAIAVPDRHGAGARQLPATVIVQCGRSIAARAMTWPGRVSYRLIFTRARNCT